MILPVSSHLRPWKGIFLTKEYLQSSLDRSKLKIDSDASVTRFKSVKLTQFPRLSCLASCFDFIPLSNITNLYKQLRVCNRTTRIQAGRFQTRLESHLFFFHRSVENLGSELFCSLESLLNGVVYLAMCV